MSRPALIFDLDGTLVHSAPSLCAAGNALLAELGRAPVSLETYIGFVGKGMRRQVEGLLAHTGDVPGEFEAHFARFRETYDADPLVATKAYPGVVAALERLAGRGHRMGICTQKAGAPARAVLEGLGLTRFFEVITAGDTLDVLKPDPAMPAHTLAGLGGGPALFMGDSETDAATARAAGMPFVLHALGYHHGALADMGADAVFEAWDEVPRLVEDIITTF